MSPKNLSKVVIAGGSGLIGRHLMQALYAGGAQVVVLSRNPDRISVSGGGTAKSWNALPGILEGADAVINLAGEGMADKRWTGARKEALLRSRVESTRRLVDTMTGMSKPPGTLVNASAVGIYGGRDGASVDEGTPPGKGFVAGVCKAWEAEADRATAAGVRVVKLRLGVVLAREGGALPKMALPARLFQGTKLGHGQQGFSWIHIEDLVSIFLRAATDPALEGPINATAPRPMTNESFTRALCHALHRPYMGIIPGFATALGTSLLFGEMAGEMLLQGAFVYPKKLQAAGFTFKFNDVSSALAELL